MLAGSVRSHTILLGAPPITVSYVPTSVLVDAWHLGGFSSKRGIGTYLRHVLAGLAADPRLRVVALATDGAELPSGVEHRKLLRLAPRRFAQREHDLLLRRDLGRATRATAANVILSPADNPLRRSPRPWVQTVHDLIPLIVPDPAFEPAAARWRRMQRRVTSAGAVVAVSGNTATDVVRCLGIDSRRVHVAHHGVDSAFRPPLERCTGQPPTIVYVGEYGPHKGFAEAFEVAASLAEIGLPHHLAMVGYLAPWHERTVRTLLSDARRPDRVDLFGYVDDLVSVYQRADALIVTSRYEGFCLPAVEAMACGTPVVAFSNSALPEVVGDGGILVPDGDVGGMVSALRALLEQPVAWKEASARGIERARAFSWDRCVAIHTDVLRSVAG
jgi:alpha-1,3-rhamnosyl/mannosyltransferase